MESFNFRSYARLCSALARPHIQVHTVHGFLAARGSLDPSKGHVILRHDVDDQPRKSLRMARIEQAYGLPSTFYLRFHARYDVDSWIDQFAALEPHGHEIGYHYETLAYSGYDHGRAAHLFEQQLSRLNSKVTVRTVCSHGNGVDMQNFQLFNDLGLRRRVGIAEAYLDMFPPGNAITYLSDTGKKWQRLNKIELDHQGDRWTVNVPSRDQVRFGDVVDHVASVRPGDALCLLVHPQWWGFNPGRAIYKVQKRLFGGRTA